MRKVLPVLIGGMLHGDKAPATPPGHHMLELPVKPDYRDYWNAHGDLPPVTYRRAVYRCERMRVPGSDVELTFWRDIDLDPTKAVGMAWEWLLLRTT